MNCFDCQSVTGINGNYYLEKHFTFIWNKAKKIVANICSVDIFNISYISPLFFRSFDENYPHIFWIVISAFAELRN